VKKTNRKLKFCKTRDQFHLQQCNPLNMQSCWVTSLVFQSGRIAQAADDRTMSPFTSCAHDQSSSSRVG